MKRDLEGKRKFLKKEEPRKKHFINYVRDPKIMDSLSEESMTSITLNLYPLCAYSSKRRRRTYYRYDEDDVFLAFEIYFDCHIIKISNLNLCIKVRDKKEREAFSNVYILGRNILKKIKELAGTKEDVTLELGKSDKSIAAWYSPSEEQIYLNTRSPLIESINTRLNIKPLFGQANDEIQRLLTQDYTLNVLKLAHTLVHEFIHFQQHLDAKKNKESYDSAFHTFEFYEKLEEMYDRLLAHFSKIDVKKFLDPVLRTR